MEESQLWSPPSPRALWHQNARCSPAFDGQSASQARMARRRSSRARSRAAMRSPSSGASSPTIARMSWACAPDVPPSHTCAMYTPVEARTRAGCFRGFFLPSPHIATVVAPGSGRTTLVIHDCCGENSGWPASPFPSRRKPAIGDSPRSSGRTVPFNSTPSRSATSFGSE